MLKLPKGLKKKKKGKKSKRKEEELFTEAELEAYKKEQQQKSAEAAAGTNNEEWSKFQDLTTGIDTVLKKTQGDLDRIKSTSFFQRITSGPKEVDSGGKAVKPSRPEAPKKPIVEVTAADFPQLAAAAATAGALADSDDERSEAVTDDESDEEDDIFDTSYVEAVERGEVKLTYVPDSPEDLQDDDLFDTTHVDAIIKGQEAKNCKGKKSLDIGVAVEVLTGRIDNVALPTSKRSKRVIPGDLFFEDPEAVPTDLNKSFAEPVQKSILDVDEEIPITTPIDLSVSLHTTLLQQQNLNTELEENPEEEVHEIESHEEEFDEFTLLATESLVSSDVVKVEKVEEKFIKAEPIVEESWSVFEADKNGQVFAEGIAEDQVDISENYEEDDPFDTSFADVAIPASIISQAKTQTTVLEDDDDFDPRAEEVQYKHNNRRKSSVRIHLTTPCGIRESITSDDIEKEEDRNLQDLLGGSTTDLTQIGDSILDPIEIDDSAFDPFDTTIVDKVTAPGKVELKFLEKELIGESLPSVQVYRVPSDPDFDPRAEESDSDFDPRAEEKKVGLAERRPSRPENLLVNKTVVFKVEDVSENSLGIKTRPPKPVTPYYTRDKSIPQDVNEDEALDSFENSLPRTKSDENLAQTFQYPTKRRHSELPKPTKPKVSFKASELLETSQSEFQAKVLTPLAPTYQTSFDEWTDPFDTSFAANIPPGKTELKLLAKEFSCEDTKEEGERDLLDPSEDSIFQIKALSPEPTNLNKVPEEDIDPFDTSFASNLQPGKIELKLLESEFLN